MKCHRDSDKTNTVGELVVRSKEKSFSGKKGKLLSLATNMTK